MDQNSGTLKFSAGFEDTLSEISEKDIKEINYYTNFSSEYLSSSTNIKNIINNSSSNSWNMTIKSPFVIRESIFDREEFKDYQNGILLEPSAQVAVEIVFNKYIQVSRLRINPNVTNGLFLVQVITESGIPDSTNQSSEQTISKNTEISSPIFIGKSTDVDLLGISYVKSMTLIFAQKDYVRTRITPIQSESNSKLINDLAKTIRMDRKKRHDTLQDLVIKFFIKDYAKDFILRNKKLYSYDYTYYYPTDLSKKSVGVLKEIKNEKYYSDLDSFNKFKNTTLLSNIVFSVISYSIGSNFRSMVKSTYIESNLKPTIKPVRSYTSGGIVPLGDSNNISENIHFLEESFSPVNQNDVANLLSNIEQQNQYEYMFSIKNIVMFRSSLNNVNDSSVYLQIPKRSIFMSKKLDLRGTPLRVKMMAEYFDEASIRGYSEANDKTSIEFSVSIKDNPTTEEDWLPIMPFNSSYVRSEMLFLDKTGVATMRFVPSPETVTVYEGQNRLAFTTYAVAGKSIKISNYRAEKKYCISYVPLNLNTAKEIPLFSRSLSAPVLSTASSGGFNGERFEKTETNNSVQLTHNPYVDGSKYVNAVYSSRNGTLATTNSTLGNFDYSSYSPVKVLLDDGTLAINLTNYIPRDLQVQSFYETDLLLFIHSGKTIIFNKPIDQPFRILYQYASDIFRYRIVMRNLDGTAENYSVNRLTFKFSLEKDDTIVNNFVKYDNKYRNRVV